MRDIASLLASYPRTRPLLPPENAMIYVEEYKINRGATAHGIYRATALLESWMHRQVAAVQLGQRVLELGAGSLNHRRYEPDALIYDVVEPFVALFEGSPELARISHIYPAIQDVPATATYDRVISVAVLEHLENLPATVASCAKRLTKDGIFQAAIPAEGGLAWGLAWRTTTGISYRLRTGLPYAPVMRHEHVNDAAEIIAIIRYFFERVRVRWFPFPTRHLAFYGYIEACNPRLDRCATAGL